MDASTDQMALALALKTVVLPAGVTAAVAAALAATSKGARWATAIAAAAGAIAAMVALHGLPELPPTDTIGWIPLLLLVAAALPVVAGRAALLTAGWFVLAVCGLYLVWRPLFALWSTGVGATWLLGTAAVGAALFAAVGATLRDDQGAPAAGALAVAAGTAGVAAALSGTASIGQLLGSVAVISGTLTVLALVTPRVVIGAPTVGVLWLATVALATYGYHFAETSLGGMALALLAAGGALGARLVPRGGWRAAIVAAMIAALPAAGAVWWAVADAPSDDPYGAYNPYEP